MSHPVRSETRTGKPSGAPPSVEPHRVGHGTWWHDCLSCDACRAECTVQRSVGRLHPSRLVRLGALGHTERVLRSRELWYCLQCLRCARSCPSAVAPAARVRAWRAEAVRRGYVDLPALERYEALCRQLWRARARLVAECVLGARDPREAVVGWERLPAPAPLDPAGSVRIEPARAERALAEDLEGGIAVPAALRACMRCRECTTACPVAADAASYDPVKVFRMVRLGLTEELLASAAIWLCLGCGRCTSACTQGVAGHRVLASLQQLAIRRGRAAADVRERLLSLDRALYPRFLEAVDRLWRA